MTRKVWLVISSKKNVHDDYQSQNRSCYRWYYTSFDPPPANIYYLSFPVRHDIGTFRLLYWLSQESGSRHAAILE